MNKHRLLRVWNKTPKQFKRPKKNWKKIPYFMRQKEWERIKREEYKALVELANNIYNKFVKLAQAELRYIKNKGTSATEEEKARMARLDRSIKHDNYVNNGCPNNFYTKNYNHLKDLPKLEDFAKDSKFFVVCGLNPSLSKAESNILDNLPKKMNLFDFIDSEFNLSKSFIDKYTYPTYFKTYYKFANSIGYNPIWCNTEEFARRTELYNINFSQNKGGIYCLENNISQNHKSKYLVFIDPIPYRHTNSNDIKHLILKNFNQPLADKTKTIEESLLYKCRKFLKAKLDYLKPELTLIANAKSCELFVYQDALLTEKEVKERDANKISKELHIKREQINKLLPTSNSKYFAMFVKHPCFVSGMLSSGVTAVANREMLFAAMTNYLNQVSKNPTTKPKQITLPL